tara:strand:+ start:178 stop:432 length:255 start_codon:yes stop_codon:yes gene_type:complete
MVVLEEQDRDQVLVCMVVEVHIVMVQLHLHLVVEMLAEQLEVQALITVVVVVEEALVVLEKLVQHQRKREEVEMVQCMIYLENQ